MNRWEIAAVVLIAAGIPCLGVCVLAGAASGLAAMEAASTLTISALMLLCEGTHRQPFIDLAVVLAVVSAVGALTFARLLEHGL